MPTNKDKVKVPQAVHDFLSEQSHKGNTQGGAISSLLIEMGKEAITEKYGEGWQEGIQKELAERDRENKSDRTGNRRTA